MWPWLTSSAGFQPATNFPIIHSTAPRPPPSHYVASQGYPTAMTHSHADFNPSHSGMGVRYGIPGMGSLPVDSNLASQVIHPENATSPGGVVYHPHHQQQEEGGTVHGVQSIHIVPSNTPAPLAQGASINQQQQQQTIPTSLGVVASLSGGAIYRQSPSPIVATPPLSIQPYPSGHAHSSSPFSVDFILRERPTTEAPVGVASSQVVPSYSVPQSEEEVVEGRTNLSDTLTPGFPHEAPHGSTHYISAEEQRSTVSSPSVSGERQLLDTDLAFSPPNESYSPPSLLEGQNMMQDTVTRMSHDIDPRGSRDVSMVESHHVMSSEQNLGRVTSDDPISCGLTSPGDHSVDREMVSDMPGDEGLHHVMSGDQELGHVTGGVTSMAASSAIAFPGEPSRIQNEAQGENWNQERDANADRFQQPSGTAIHDAEDVQVPRNDSNDEDRFNQGGSSFIQDTRHSQAEEVKSSELKDAHSPEEVNQTCLATKPAQTVTKADISLDTPISQREAVPPVNAPSQQPTAVNALKRCVCETYSSDDDDVFLPNPPSKSQADKCIVAMVTDDEADPPTTTNTAVDDAAPGSSEVVSMETPGGNEGGENGDTSMDKVENKGEGELVAPQVRTTLAMPADVVMEGGSIIGVDNDRETRIIIIKRGRGAAKMLDLYKLQMPLQQGWRRLVRKRIGADQVRVDICYITPDGRRLRTFPEIQRHLDLKSDKLTMDHFTFSKKVDLGETLNSDSVEVSPDGSKVIRRGRGRRPKVSYEPSNLQHRPSEQSSSQSTVEPTVTVGRTRGRGRGMGRGRGSRGGAARNPVGRPKKEPRQDLSKLATHSSQAFPSRSVPTVVTAVKKEPQPTLPSLSPAKPTTSIVLQKVPSRPGKDDGTEGVELGGSDSSRLVGGQTPAVQHTRMGGTGEIPSASGGDEEKPVGNPRGVATPPPLVEPGAEPVFSSQQSKSEVDDKLNDRTTVDSYAPPPPLKPIGNTPPGPGTPNNAHSNTASSVAVETNSALHVYRKRGPKRKAPVIDPTTEVASNGSLPLQPSIKRRRGRPKGSGVHSEVVISRRGGGGRGRGGRKGGRLASHARLTAILPRTDPTRKVSGETPSPGASVAAGLPGSGTPNAQSGTDREKGGGVDVGMQGQSSSWEGSSQMAAGGGGGSGGLSAMYNYNFSNKKAQEEKRRQLLLKARADKAKKKEARHMQRSMLLSQRKVAQRQRRERERLAQKLAREKQEKVLRQREDEARELRRHHMARQKQVDFQQRAQERTLRLLAYLKQQELDKHRKMYQQQLDIEKAEQLKRPTEDLEVRETSSLPSLPALAWVRLPADAFSSLLMVVEFTHSFDEFLEVEPAPPPLGEVYLSLYNGGGGKVMMDLCAQLLKAAIYDPSCDAMTVGGCPIETIDVNMHTLSELIRLYLEDRAEADMDHILQSLETMPLQCLCPSDKIRVLAFLVGELLDSGTLTKEVDMRMEQVASLRREKWKISLKLKRFRSRLSNKFGITNKQRSVVYSGRGRPPKGAGNVILQAEGGGETTGDEEDEPGQSVVAMAMADSEVEDKDREYSEEETDEETPEKKDALLKRIRTLKKKIIFIRNRIYHASKLMRKFPLGQDRYARQYWIMPTLGAVLIEGVETSLDANLQLGTAKDFMGVAKDRSKCESHFSLAIGSEELNQPVSKMASFNYSGSEHELTRGAESAKVAGCNIEMQSGSETEERPSDSFLNQDSDLEVYAVRGEGSGRADVGEGMEVGTYGSRDGARQEGEERPPRSRPEPQSVSAVRVVREGGSALLESVYGDTNVSNHQQQQQQQFISGGVREEGGRTHSGMPAAAALSESFVYSQKQSSSPRHPPPPSATEHAQLLGGKAKHQRADPGDTSAVVHVAPGGHMTIRHVQSHLSEHAASQVCAGESMTSHVTEAVASRCHVAPRDQGSVASQVTQSTGDQVTSSGDLFAEHGPWFSLSSRRPCESPQGGTYPTNQIQSVAPVSSTQQAISPDTSQLPNQQQLQLPTQEVVPSAAASAPQYVYVTADGQVLGAAPPQVAQQMMTAGGMGGGVRPEATNIGYALVGNSLVPVATGGGCGQQFVAVNSGAANQQLMQYVVAQADQQGGVQYMAVPGGIDGAAGLGGWPSQQPQYFAITDANGQQQTMQVVTRENGGQVLMQLPANQLQGQLGGQLMMAAAQPQSNQMVIGQGQMGQLVVAAAHQQPGGQVVLGQAGQEGQLMVAAAPPAQASQQVVMGQAGQAGQLMVAAAPPAQASQQVVMGQVGQTGQLMVAAAPPAQASQQVLLGQAGQAGQLMVAAAPPVQASQQVVMGQAGQAGQLMVAAAPPAQASQQVMMGQAGQAGQLMVAAAPPVQQVVMGQAGQAGQLMVAAAPPAQAIQQVVMGQAGQAGQLMVAAAPPAQASQQVVMGQAGQAGQLMVAAAQASQQVVMGQAGQAGQLVVAAAPPAQASQQVVMGQGLVIAGQCPERQSSNQVVVRQEQSNEVLTAAVPAAEHRSPLTGHGQGGTSGSFPSTQLQDPVTHDVIRGGQVVQIPEQNQFGILSSDRTKLMITESKEAAIALLQAADSIGSSAGLALNQVQQPQHSTPAVVMTSPPVQSDLTTPIQCSSSYGAVNIKKEPLSPDLEVPRNLVAAPALAAPTTPHLLSGKTTPTTVGQSTASIETTDSSRQQEEQQFITAVLPAGPGGEAQYISLPADPRILSGQCSYAMLQQSDGSRKIVMMENSAGGNNAGNAPSFSTTSTTGPPLLQSSTDDHTHNSIGDVAPPQLTAFEVPSQALMCNEDEGDPWMVEISLMYAQDATPFSQPNPEVVGVSKSGVVLNEASVKQKDEKSLRELLEEQDVDLTHGWWSITDSSAIDNLLRSFCLRGFREKNLFKALQKNKEMICRTFDPSNLQACSSSFINLLSQLDSNYDNPAKLDASVESMDTDEAGGSAEENTEKDEGVKLGLVAGVKEGVNVEGAPRAEDESGPAGQGLEVVGAESSSSSSSSGSSSSSSSNNNDSSNRKACKDQQEEKSDSDDNSSDSDTSSSSLSSPNPNSSQGEDDCVEEDEDDGAAVHPKPSKPCLSLATSQRGASVSTFNQVSISLCLSHPVPGSGIFDPEFSELSCQFALKVLEYLEEVIERLFTAQLQEENCHRLPRISHSPRAEGSSESYLPIISKRLISLEISIYRRYLKPPLRDRKIYEEENPKTRSKSRSRGGREKSGISARREAPAIELPSEELLKWRRAVEVATSASQMAVCLSQLERCIMWEKSSSVGFCQVCRGGENESLLLLCDGCDRGTHTYCCKPELSKIPDGDWYCRDCLLSHSSVKPCHVCDSTRGVLLVCVVCPKSYHKRCLNPPLNRIPTGPWKCSTCKHKNIPKSRAKGNSGYHTGAGGRKRLPRDDASICKYLMKLVEDHEHSWPFLEPVGKKEFPEYYKVIKKPMDFQTMREKMLDGRYDSDKEQFASDARQVFSNCSYYNEDDSEIGIAGHQMKSFFEKKWSDLSRLSKQ